MDRVIYADDVCERLNIKTGSLYKLINSHELNSFKLCGRRAFMQSDIDGYIRKISGKNETQIVDIRNMTPKSAMAKGLEDIEWDTYTYDQLCKIWSLIGEMNEERADEKAGQN
jgi:hypothetical protein